MSKIVTLVAANLDKEKPGDLKYRAFLRSYAGRPSVRFLTEVGSGKRSTRLVVRGLETRRPRRVEIGRKGVHRWVMERDVWLQGQWVRCITVHGLHRRTVGDVTSALFLDILLTHIRETAGHMPVIVGGDFNLNVVLVAEHFGGLSVGDGVEGFVVIGDLGISSSSERTYGMKKGYTDHPERFMWVKA